MEKDSLPVVLSPETQRYSKVCEILERNNNDRSRLIPILQQVQEEYHYLPEEVLTFIATPRTLELMETVAKAVRKGSLCGLGKTAPNPVLAMMRHFREEIEAHVLQKRCPSGRCQALAEPEILAHLCKGCTLCVRKCPVDAIAGERKKPHAIDIEKCIRCGACAEACKFNAVVGI
jgi:NADH-quinone oxidoreductase subunit F